MRVLALDTTTRAGSVAVVEDDRIVVQRGGDPARTHAERLPAEILNVLQDAGLALPAVDIFQATGAVRTAMARSFVVTVADGQLSLDFTGVQGRAIVSNIAVERQ